MNKSRYLILPLLAVLASCTAEIAIAPEEENPAGLIPDVPYITAILPGGNDETKISFEYTDARLKASWVPGDDISIVPAGCFFSYAGLYTLPSGGGTSAEFEKTTAVGLSMSKYCAFFPGSRLKCYCDLTHWYYDGQVQSKADPMAHLADYFLMYKEITTVGTVDFTDAVKSSCLCVNTSGKVFNTPTKLTVRIVGKGSFSLNDGIDGSYPIANPNTGHEPNDLEYGKAISVGLQGYGDHQYTLQAWIAMSSLDVQLYKGDIVRVLVDCADGTWCSDYTLGANTTLTGGKCHSLTVDGNWKKTSADYTQYDFDGELVTVQEPGLGLSLAFMGDGFIGADFSGGDNSTYMQAMYSAVEQFFSIQPYIYLRDYFDIYIIKAVSPQRTEAITTYTNGAKNTGTETVFSTMFTPNSTNVTGDNDAVRRYLKAALGTEKCKNITALVIANAACRAGSCYMFYTSESQSYDYARASESLAYFGLGKNPAEWTYLVRHEAGGHGFGKLADEYFYDSYQFSSVSTWNNRLGLAPYGFYRNSDRFVNEAIQAKVGTSYPLTDQTNVKWADMFGTVNNYETVESLDIYEGSSAYVTGFCRSTPNSIMNESGTFNSVSRRAIMYRARCLMGQLATGTDDKYGSEAELGYFLQWDAQYGIPEYLAAAASAPAPAPRSNCVEQYPRPLPPPVLIFGHWEGDRFVEEFRQ